MQLCNSIATQHCMHALVLPDSESHTASSRVCMCVCAHVSMCVTESKVFLCFHYLYPCSAIFKGSEMMEVTHLFFGGEDNTLFQFFPLPNNYKQCGHFCFCTLHRGNAGQAIPDRMGQRLLGKRVTFSPPCVSNSSFHPHWPYLKRNAPQFSLPRLRYISQETILILVYLIFPPWAPHRGHGHLSWLLQSSPDHLGYFHFFPY